MKPSLSLRNTERSFSPIPVSRLPSTRISPLLTRSIVEITFSKVLFPEPDAPMMAVNSPFSTSNEMPSRAFVTTVPLP